MIVASICSLIIAGVFLRMSVNYTRKRANRVYANDRIAAPSISGFKNISKILFISSMLMTLSGYWTSSILLLQMHSNPYLQLLGALVVLYGCIRLEAALCCLGKNYSPLFDAYQPLEIITKGPYQLIRHPIYLYNLFVSFGLAISSGSVFVTINAMIGLVFILKTIYHEEVFLSETFADYIAYKQNSWRLIPRVF
jgi:protein-S-isoprenylcysteine O-methyltransferase Ste14